MTSISRRQFGRVSALTSVAGAAAAAGFSASAARAHSVDGTQVQNATLVSLTRGAGTSHTFVTNNDGRVTIHLIDGPDGLIIVDAGDGDRWSTEVRAMADALGKPIAGVLVSHDHPDHISGLGAYAGAPIMTTRGILDNIANAPWPSPEIIGDAEAIAPGALRLGGLDLTVSVYENAESAEQIVIEIPELDTAIVQDLVYNNAFFFPGVDRPNWIATLQTLRGSLDAETLLVGHGYPASRGELTAAIDYLSEFEAMIAAASGPEELGARMRERWPDRMADTFIGFLPMVFPQ